MIDDPRWPDDGSLAASSKEHVEAGLWAFYSVNPNAWAGVQGYLRHTSADFVFAQEVRVMHKSCRDLEESMRHDGWKLAIQACVFADTGVLSAGTAVACRKYIGTREGLEAASAWKELDGRFQAKWIGAVCKGGLYGATCYMHSNIGIRAKINLDMLHAMAAVLRQCGEAWVLGGDFNTTPQELRATGWLGLVGGIICEPKAATCGDRKLDFFVVSQSLAHAVRSVHVVGDAGFKPHSPVRLLLRAKPRTLVLKSLAPPLRFGADVPYGPPNTAGDVIEQGSHDYGRCITLIERELSLFCGHDDTTAALHAGKAEGPWFRWKAAANAATAQRQRTTSVSRAWRRVATWLSEIRTTKLEARRRAAQWKVLRCEHPQPDPARASAHQLAGLRRVERRSQ